GGSCSGGPTGFWATGGGLAVACGARTAPIPAVVVVRARAGVADDRAAGVPNAGVPRTGGALGGRGGSGTAAAATSGGGIEPPDEGTPARRMISRCILRSSGAP